METVNGILKQTTKGPIVCSRVYNNGEFQKAGTLTAEIKQQIKTISKYPSKRVDSNMQSNVFGAEDFGFESKEYPSVETRVAWIPVPMNSTVESVQAKLDAAHKNGACIYRVLSCQPILDNNQKYAISQGQRTLDQYADAQAVRVPSNEQTIADGTANKLVLDVNGNVQYRRTYFWLTPMEDHDIRNQEVPYISPALAAEKQGASVLQGQTI
jgi:hypothetical protein